MHNNTTVSRRSFVRSLAALSTLGIMGGSRCLAEIADKCCKASKPYFKTRGAVLAVQDLANSNWPRIAKQANLTTIGTHIFPEEVAAFFKTDKGHMFMKDCDDLGIKVEHELHAMKALLPRDLFKKDPKMFRMDEKGNRILDWNCCVHSKEALEVIGENAVKYARLCKSTSGRHFFWIDDAKPMCACPKCKAYSDSDQALMINNTIVKALRKYINPEASLAHLSYYNTLIPPKLVKPEPGIFLEFAPIHRSWSEPLRNREIVARNMQHGKVLDALDANLEFFGAKEAQVLEYWLDVSLFSNWNRKKKVKLPWNREVFLDDLKTYGSRGIRHITSFAVFIDNNYIKQYGMPPINEYGKGLLETCPSK